jgi:hypothetical protein
MQPTLGRLGLELSTAQLMSAKQHGNWRFAVQALLHQQLVEKSGAKFFTPFFIRSKDAHRDLWLIHLSNHFRARDVMTGLHWTENRSFAHYGGPGLMMLGYDQDFDECVAGLPFLFDDDALIRTRESLLNQLPARLAKFKDAVPFHEFFAGLTNETPATTDIVKNVLATLQSDGEIEIHDESGTVQRKAGVQRHNDILRRPARRTLFLP